jgi:hypothetical protein
MNNIKNLIVASAMVFLVSSCSVSYPFLLTNNPIGSKKGKSTTVTLFGGSGRYATSPAPFQGKSVYNGIMLNKDFGLPEAVKKGKISKVATVDIRYDWYFFFSKTTFLVTGE